MQKRAYERLDALQDINTEEAYFQALLAQNPHLSQIPLTQHHRSNVQAALVHTNANQQQVPSLNKKCLRDAITEYQSVLAITKQAEKSKKMALSTLNDLSEKLGADFDMSFLDDEAVEDKWLTKRLNEVAATTAKRDLSFIRAFVNWAADKKRMYCPTPLNLSLNAKGEHWKYYVANDLKSLFSKLEIYADKPWRFWIPILGLCTGARISELASIKTSYFFEKSGFHVMHLAGTKTDASPRVCAGWRVLECRKCHVV